MNNDSNSAKGQKSFDSVSTGQLINFINKNVSEYPTEIGGPRFDLVPVQKEKDQMLNLARMYAQQEYDRIMALVRVLQDQAQQIKRRLEITDLIYSAEYKFKIFPGQSYWLAENTNTSKSILTLSGPTEWATGVPDYIKYICRVKYLADHTWTEVVE